MKIISAKLMTLSLICLIGCSNGKNGKGEETPVPTPSVTSSALTLSGKVISEIETNAEVTLEIGGTRLSIPSNKDGSYSFTLDMDQLLEDDVARVVATYPENDKVKFVSILGSTKH
ncbi:hypothetical protein ACJJIX_19735 [Microbulbifer sp. VAAC004]|uniref:hypothetical protein n=1 Tax=unclassified Microbulbifer TaxID=2619833 RepID=UPI00403A413C